MNSRLTRTALFVLVLTLLAVSLRAATVPASSLKHAENMLKTSSLPPNDPDWPGLPRLALRQTMDAFQGIITKYGPNGRVFLDMSNVAMQEGDYLAALRLAEQAQPLLKSRSVTQRALEDAGLHMQIDDAASTKLPKDQFILRVMSLSAPGQRNLWVVLSAKQGSPVGDYPTYSNVLLSLFRGTQQNLTRVWRSDPLGYPGYTNGVYNDLQLYLVDMNHDGTPEAVIPMSSIGADWLPSYIDVYSLRAGRLVNILGANSEFPARITDLNHDQTYEVLTSHSIGWNIPRVAMPQWEDIYAYKNGAYRISNGDFAGEYKDTITQIRSALKSYPNDFELHQYLGMAYQIRGDKKGALAEYRTALTLGRNVLASEQDPQRSARVQRELDELQERITALEG